MTVARALAALVAALGLRAADTARVDVAARGLVLATCLDWAAAQTTGAKIADNYPIGGLKCYYSNKKGMNTGYATTSELESILCPEGQNKFCVRQVVNGLAPRPRPPLPPSLPPSHPPLSRRGRSAG